MSKVPASFAGRVLVYLGAFALVAGVAAYLFWRPVLTGIAETLIVSDSLEKSDAIAVLRGHEGGRCPKAAALHLDGWAPRILITKDRIPYEVGELRRFGILQMEEHEKAVEILQYLGVPKEAITVIGGFNEGTVFEARRLRDFMLDHNLKSLIVVTSNYHTRRTRLLFGRIFTKAGLRAAVQAAPPDWQFDPGEWWTRRRDSKALLDEYLKLFFYFLRYW